MDAWMACGVMAGVSDGTLVGDVMARRFVPGDVEFCFK